MQEEEKTAVTSAESSETPAPPEAGGAERSRTVLLEEPELLAVLVTLTYVL